MVQVVQIGRGGEGNLDKIQKNSYFFRETFPKSGEHRKHGEHGKDGKHQPDDLKHFCSIYMIQNTPIVTQNTVFVNQVTQNTLVCSIIGDG